MIAPPDIVTKETELNDSFSEDDNRSEATMDALISVSPFIDSEVEGIFYPGGRRQECCQELLHLFRYGPPLIVVHGEIGVGKRFLLEHTLAKVDPEVFRLALVEAERIDSVSQYLDALTAPWRIDQEINRDNYHQLIVSTAKEADACSQTLLVVINSAQILDNETSLVVALMLAATKGLPVKVVLVVDGDDLKSVDNVQGLLDHMPNHYVIPVKPLTKDQLQEYLAYRMRVSGLGDVSFNADQISYLIAESGGNLRKVNEIAQMFLDDTLPAPERRERVAKGAFLSGLSLSPATWSKVPWSALPWPHIGALSFVVVVIVGLLLSYSGDESPVTKAPSVEPGTTQEPTKLGVSALNNTPPQEAVAADLSAEEAGSSTAVVGAGNPEDQVVFEFDQPINEEAAPVEPAQESSDVEPTTNMPEAIESSEVVAEAAPEPKANSAPAPKETVAVSSGRNSWVRGLPSDHYVMQLLGAKEMATVERFLSQYPSLQEVTYYQTKRKDGPWFVVIQGNYASRDAAKQAIQRFPASLKKQSPWIRKVEEIKKELEN